MVHLQRPSFRAVFRETGNLGHLFSGGREVGNLSHLFGGAQDRWKIVKDIVRNISDSHHLGWATDIAGLPIECSSFGYRRITSPKDHSKTL